MASIIPLLNKLKLKPVWNYDAGAIIWQIFTSNDHIIGETRNQEEKSTSFFCINGQTGIPLWKNIGFDEPWWIGVEAVQEKWMILHGFARPDMPAHRGIRVIDIESGKLLWKNDDLTFWFINNEKLYTHKYLFEKHFSYELDLETGAILKDYSNNLNLLQELRQKVLRGESNQNVIFPDLFNENETNSVIRTIIKRITEGKAIDSCIEYVSHRGIIIVSYYCNAQNQSKSFFVNNILSVYDLRNENMLYSEIIAKDLQVPSPDTFFIKDDLLFFVTTSNYLNSLTTMEIITEHFKVATHGNSEVINITGQVADLLQKKSLKEGSVTLFVVGSTASITTTEFEPGLKKDIPEMLERIAPSDVRYHHDDTWGDGNGHAHFRASFIGPSLVVHLQILSFFLEHGSKLC